MDLEHKIIWERLKKKKIQSSMPTPKKIRKRRSSQAYDLCSCGYVNCDPAWGFGHSGVDKIHERLENGECMGCGKKHEGCKCKSSNNGK